MTPQEEQRLKDQFIAENPYAERGMKAALMHNPLYADRANRKEIQNEWIARMTELAQRYTDSQLLDVFLTDVCALKSCMNEAFHTSFRNEGFRYSHAQKSFSVFLKYRWCQGMIPAPPSCPIDHGVLFRLGRPFSSWRWTRMEECQYMATYLRLQREAMHRGLSVAQMELEWFGH